VRPDELERRLHAHLDALGPAPRAELLRVLMLPDLERGDAIGTFWGHPETRTFGELLIDLEEYKAAGRSRSGCSENGAEVAPSGRGRRAASYRLRLRERTRLQEVALLEDEVALVHVEDEVHVPVGGG